MSDENREYRSMHLVAPELLAALQTLPKLALSNESIVQIRQPFTRAFEQGLRQLPTTSSKIGAIACEQNFIPGLAGAPDVRILVYKPTEPADRPRPACLHIHGGGYVLGGPEINDAFNLATAAELDCVVVSVDYRLAPETRFPGALEDCYAALEWLARSADYLEIDLDRIAIVGESAGGGHAAALAIYARDRGEIPICLQLLDSPMLDDRTGSTHEPHPYCGELVWTPESNRFGWRSLLGVEPGGPDVKRRAVPARADNLDGLPPTFIVVGALDLFAEESIEFARRLIHAGVPTELHVIPGAFHGFTAAGPEAPQVRQLLQLRSAALQRAFSRRND